MKTERRQELKTNDLGAFLVEVNDWMRKYAYQIGAAAGVVVLALVVVLYVQRSQASSVDASWQAMLELSFAPEKAEESFTALDRLIEQTGDRGFDMTALLLKASNARGMITQPDGFHPEYLDDAEQAYKSLLDEYGDRMQVAATALSGLAYVEECRFVVDGDGQRRQRARKYLERLQNEARFKGTPYQTAAAERLLSLDDAFRPVTLAEALPPPPEPAAIKPSTAGTDQTKSTTEPAGEKPPPAAEPEDDDAGQETPENGSGSQP